MAENKIYYKMDSNKSKSIIKIDCGMPIYIYTKIKYN